MSFTKIKNGDSTTSKGSALTREQQIDKAVSELQAVLGVGGGLGQAKAAAITSPTAPSAGYVQAEAASAKTAIDAIIAVLKAAGLTA